MKRLNELKTDLLKCGYPKQLVNDSIQKFKDADSDTLRIPRSAAQGKVLTFVKTHNPGNPNFYRTILNSLPMLDKSPKMKEIMSKTTIIQSSRQPKNLKRLLTSSTFGDVSDPNHVPGVKKCNHRNCMVCEEIIEGNVFNISGQKFTIKHDMNCSTSSVIYCLQCNKCKEQYIGQTGGPLQRRLALHRNHINQERNRVLPVSHHIARCANGLKPPFRVFPFYKAINMSDHEREIKEQFFIDKYKPKLNSSN